MKIADLYRNIVTRLKNENIPDPEIEAELLLEHVFDKNRVELFLSGEEKAPETKINSLDELLARRLQHEPLAYLLGEKEFWSLSFRVTRDVLIPRSETEQLLELVIQTVKKGRDFFDGPILDLGVGSGVISIVIALELPQAQVVGIDRSFKALKVSTQNAIFHGVRQRVHFICADWGSAVKAGQRFSLVVSNPPYVAAEDFPSLQPELDFEPRGALDGGKKGIEEIERILPTIQKFLAPGGWFFMEIGEKQGDYLLNRFEDMPEFDEVRVHKDYAGLPRFFQARLKVS